MNALPPSPSVGGKLIPRQIVTGLTIDYTNHFRIQFGEYPQVHEYHDNNMQERTTGAIALRPTGNAQGAYFFMSLTNGQRMNLQSFTPLPLPQDVINGVNSLARRNPKGLDIRHRDRRPFLDNEDGAKDDRENSAYAPSDDDSRNKEYDSDDNQSNHENLHPPPAQ